MISNMKDTPLSDLVEMRSKWNDTEYKKHLNAEQLADLWNCRLEVKRGIYPKVSPNDIKVYKSNK